VSEVTSIYPSKLKECKRSQKMDKFKEQTTNKFRCFLRVLWPKIPSWARMTWK
jgi:hypothetical protein